MTSPDQHRADADLRQQTAALLMAMADAVTSGRVKRWQLECVANSLAMLHHVLTEPVRAEREGR